MKINLSPSATIFAVLSAAVALACSGDEESGNPGSNGGTPTIGGKAATGGTATSAGGASGGITTGGSQTGGLGSGGVSGGAAGRGASAGATTGGSTGGSSSPSAGRSSGGTSAGGSGGGTAGSGSGGMSRAGAAGSGVAGGSSAGAGGSGSGGGPGSGGGATASKGCGGAATPMACSTSGSPCMLDVSGTARRFYVVLPSNYDAAKPYPVVFQFHPLGGNAEQGMNMYNVRPNFPDAIYVTPQGLGSQPGWANTNGEDVAFTRAMIADVEAKYCVDTSRYFSTGFSYGGIMSFTIACQMADVFRAIAPMAGFQFGMEASCKPARPIAAWISNGADDTLVDPDGAAVLKDILVTTNHCETTSSPVEPSPCVTYAGCDAGYPVTWCLVEGQGHAIPNYGSKSIAAFFKQF